MRLVNREIVWGYSCLRAWVPEEAIGQYVRLDDQEGHWYVKPEANDKILAAGAAELAIAKLVTSEPSVAEPPAEPATAPEADREAARNQLRVVRGNFGERAPDDTAALLRDLADAAEAGEVSAIISACIRNGEYKLNFGSSLANAVVLSSLLWQRSCERMRN